MRCPLAIVAALAFVIFHPAPALFASLDSCTYTGGRLSGRATVIDAQNLLRSDGDPEYVDRTRGTLVYAQAALNLFPFRRITAAVAPQRQLLVDLNEPVPNGGGNPRGVIVLHDVQNPSKSIPLGLYHMSFEIRYAVNATAVMPFAISVD